MITRLLAEVEPGKNPSNITLEEKDKSADFQSSTCIFPARWSPSLAVHQIHAFMFLHLSWTYPGESPFSQGNKGMDPETMEIGLWARMALFNFGNMPQISIFWILVGRRKQQKANTTTEKVKVMPERGTFLCSLSSSSWLVRICTCTRCNQILKSWVPILLGTKIYFCFLLSQISFPAPAS